MLETIKLSLLEALGCASVILVPFLIGALMEARKEIKRAERELEKQRYAHTFFVSQINDMIENGHGGKVLEHLIKSGQL